MARCKHYCHHMGEPQLQLLSMPAWPHELDGVTEQLLQVLPIMGLILQAPFESNKNWSTLLASARWIGNPAASLSYVLWNIHVTGRCAMLVDMASKYGDLPKQDSQFGHMRDSLYILNVMNQCKLDRLAESRRSF